MKLVIEREHWERGTSSARLRKDNGQMCCLGFFGLACGIEPDTLLGAGSPEEIADRAWPDWALLDSEGAYHLMDSETIELLIEANDGKEATEPEREARIAELFAEHGVEVEFV